MPVLGLLSYTLEVPSLEEGVQFYTDAGLQASTAGDVARFRCAGQDRDSVVLMAGFPKKRLHHVTLRAEGLDAIAADIASAGGQVVPAPAGHDESGLWAVDPNGALYHLVECPADAALAAETPFEINAPGRLVRKGRPAILPGSAYSPARPRKLGHVMMFSPDVMASVRFVTEGLGMGLADHSEDIVAFTCVRKNSDHHVLAFGKSPGIGFHHASFQVGNPDEVGRGGRALVEKAGRGDWGFGRHAIGSNFFHYIQDPWGSWFEYYSDMDHIEDYSAWTPTNYAPQDSLVSWGPQTPPDFITNYEVETETA
jgi:catechol 2,3-dioxygenase